MERSRAETPRRFNTGVMPLDGGEEEGLNLPECNGMSTTSAFPTTQEWLKRQGRGPEPHPLWFESYSRAVENPAERSTLGRAALQIMPPPVLVHLAVRATAENLGLESL
jgi:hypothetical protein